MSDFPRRAQFLYRETTITAWATPVDHVHKNVLRLSVIRTSFQERIAIILSRLPRFMSRLLSWLRPEYFLAKQVILKTLKPGQSDAFNTEKAMYKRLKPLQGRILPWFLGEAEHHGSPAIVLSHIDGVPLSECQSSPMPVGEFTSQIEAALWAFTKFGVLYSDLKPDNCLISEGRVMLVDLEAVSEEKEADYELGVTSNRNKIVQEYKSLLNSWESPL